jgi:two-component system, LytTR family, sensor kinase
MKKPIVLLLHLLYWVMYLLLIAMFFAILNSGKMHITFKFLCLVLFLKPFGWSTILPGLLGFYTFYLILFDRFLTKQKILKLFLSASIFAFIGSIITELIIYIAFHNQGINWGPNDLFTIGFLIAFITLVNGAAGLIMKGFINWYNDIKIKVALNKRNYEMELAMLKSQINPHFLFNTINNIDVLITKDAIRASEYLNKLSDIMRFMLYETRPAKIPLNKELTYIEKFIELQKIRTTNEHYINYSLKGDPANFMIPPMILIPFIENAFKHAENKKAENAININLDVENEKFIFKCENTYNQSTQMKPEHSGLGSEIIKKRLSLLYPDKHKLTITNNNELYKVELSLY